VAAEKSGAARDNDGAVAPERRVGGRNAHGGSSVCERPPTEWGR
jgi:hypothetical protein